MSISAAIRTRAASKASLAMQHRGCMGLARAPVWTFRASDEAESRGYEPRSARGRAPALHNRGRLADVDRGTPEEWSRMAPAAADLPVVRPRAPRPRLRLSLGAYRARAFFSSPAATLAAVSRTSRSSHSSLA